MAKNLLHELFSGNWRDPDTGKNVTLPAREAIIQTGITARTAEYIGQYMARRFLLVCDETTYEIQGREIERNIKKKGWKNSPLIFPRGVKPEIANVEMIEKAAADAEMIIGVGSGTINDLCKYSSFRLGVPYLIFGTAPSMNGYASANASIIVDGYKKTLAAHMPEGIYLDLDVLAKAPLQLIRSGVGDMACRPTAQGDWLLSHLLLGTPYKTAPFVLLEENERQLREAASGLIRGDVQAMKILAEGLILSGIGMYIAGSSASASQGEHLIAHYMEMLHPELPEVFHGEQIGVTTLTMLEIQSRLLANKITMGDYVVNEPEILKKFGPKTGAEMVRQVRIKAELYEKSHAREKINNEWEKISAQLAALLPEPGKIRMMLESIGAPTTSPTLGWRSHYAEAVANAFLLRDRFTFLDLAHLIF